MILVYIPGIALDIDYIINVIYLFYLNMFYVPYIIKRGIFFSLFSFEHNLLISKMHTKNFYLIYLSILDSICKTAVSKNKLHWKPFFTEVCIQESTLIRKWNLYLHLIIRAIIILWKNLS